MNLTFDELLTLRETGVISDDETRQMLGLDEPSKAALPDETLREFAYQKALGYKEQKLNRTRAHVKRLEHALAKQKAQTADDQQYIDLLEAAIAPSALAKIRDEARGFRHSTMNTYSYGWICVVCGEKGANTTDDTCACTRAATPNAAAEETRARVPTPERSDG